MDATLQIAFQIVNLVLAGLVIAGFVFFIIVIFKLNKALDIWLKKNTGE
jgi:hypothetical protein